MVRRIDGIVELLNTDNGKIGLWSRDLLMCNSSIFLLSFLAFQLLFVQLGGGWKKENEVEGTWTRFRDCADSCNSFVQTCTTVSAKHLTAKKERKAKTVFEHLYLVVGLRKFAPWVNCPCSATPPLFSRQLFLDFCETAMGETLEGGCTSSQKRFTSASPFHRPPAVQICRHTHVSAARNTITCIYKINGTEHVPVSALLKLAWNRSRGSHMHTRSWVTQWKK